RHSAGGGQRHGERRSQREVGRHVRCDGRNHRTCRLCHLCGDPCRWKGTDGAYARRDACRRRSEPYFRIQSRQGGAVRSEDVTPDLNQEDASAGARSRPRDQTRPRGEANEEPMANPEAVDILIIGSGMGGATCAAGLAPTGARILILERGGRLRDSADARDARAIFQRGVFRPPETWLDGAAQRFNPGNYYYVGGNTKLYGAVLLRYRSQDFQPTVHAEGATTGWPFDYDELEPWYTRAEKLYQVRGGLGFDETEPRHSEPFPFGPVPDEPAIARVRERMKGVGLHPFPLPLGVDIDRWLMRAKTPWDAFPDTGAGKMDAESCGLAEALRYPNVDLRENVKVERLVLDPDGKRLAGVEASIIGERKRILARIVILSAG